MPMPDDEDTEVAEDATPAPEETLTARQWQARVLQTRDRMMEGRRRVWPDGETRTCPACGDHALMGESDLMREVDTDGAVLVFANLHGARCASCGTEFLEGYEQAAIEERAGTAFRGATEGSITTLGGNKLGTYWPKDVAAAVEMHAQDKLKITPLSPDTLVVRIVHGPGDGDGGDGDG